MSNILEAVKKPVIVAYNFVSTNAVELGTKACNLGGRVVSAVTPVLSNLVAKIQSFIQSLNPQSFFSKTWDVVKANPGPSAILLTGAVGTIALSLCVKSTVAKYCLRIAGVAILVLSAVAATTPFGNKAIKV